MLVRNKNQSANSVKMINTVKRKKENFLYPRDFVCSCSCWWWNVLRLGCCEKFHRIVAHAIWMNCDIAKLSSIWNWMFVFLIWQTIWFRLKCAGFFCCCLEFDSVDKIQRNNKMQWHEKLLWFKMIRYFSALQWKQKEKKNTFHTLNAINFSFY